MFTLTYHIKVGLFMSDNVFFSGTKVAHHISADSFMHQLGITQASTHIYFSIVKGLTLKSFDSQLFHYHI